MTIIPMQKKCPKCHKNYDFNPDVGKVTCPYCQGLGKPSGGVMGKGFDKKKDSSKKKK